MHSEGAWVLVFCLHCTLGLPRPGLLQEVASLGDDMPCSILTDYRLAPSKWDVCEEPASAPWARTEETLYVVNEFALLGGWMR
jgi:hypothetical protein